MQLLPSIRQCIHALEMAGFAAYAVGGCVRDDLLGLTPLDYDLCTDALPEQTQQVLCAFPQDLTGIGHGTVRVTLSDCQTEITTFRTDGSYTDNRHPDSVRFVTDIAQDLARRDFTVNAMAWSPTRGYADPFGGRQDLAQGILRTVGDPEVRFREDSLRILRGMRFSARFHLTPEPKTLRAMLALAPLTDSLARERVFAELCGFLTAARVEDLLRFAPILARLLPEVAPTVGFQQHSPHHAYDVFTHTAHVTASAPPDPVLRWAALLHDTGKVPTFHQDETGRGHFRGHAQAGAALADQALTRLHAPARLRQRVVWLIDRHMTRLCPEESQLRRCLSRYGREATYQLLCLQEADMASKGVSEGESTFPQVRVLLARLEAEEGVVGLKTLAVDGTDLTALGFSGRPLGQCLQRLLEQVLDGTLPNEKNALLAAAEQIKQENG